MLRTLFVLIVFFYGLYHSVKSPFHALLLYLWVAHFRPLEWAASSWLGDFHMSMIAAAVLVPYTLIAHRRYSMNTLQGFMLLFCLLGGISTWQSVDVAYSWVWYSGFIKVVVMSYLLSVLVDNLDKFRWVVIVICVSLGGEATRQAFTGLLSNTGAKNLNQIASLGDNNGVGLGMLLLLALIIGLYKSSEKRWVRVFFVILGTGVLVRAVTTYSRGAFVTLVVLLALLWLQGNKKFRGAIAIGLIAAALLSVMPQRYYDRMATVTQVTQEEGIQESSAASRIYLWEVAIRMANDNPITGVGFNAYSRAYGWYDVLHGGFGEKREAHGSLPGVLADTGYIGGLTYALMLLTALMYMSRIKRQAYYLPAGEELRYYATALQNALVCFLVGGAFLSFMYYEIVWHLLGLCAALAVITKRMLAEQVRAAAIESEAKDKASTPNMGYPPGGRSQPHGFR